jgi:polyisoprenoid-binding protein YceI
MTRMKLALGAVIGILILSACSPVPAQTAPDPTQPPAPTAAQADVPTRPAPTESQSASVDPTPTSEISGAAAGQTTFTIVSEKSEVSYSVEETFLNENNRLNTAIGKTSQITGQLSLDLANPADSASGDFTVDISTLTTDSSRRDNAIRRQWLESSRYPQAKFTINQITDFPANPQEGQAVQFKLAGDLSIRETTKPITWDVTATLNGDQLTGTATTFLMMADWGVTPPDIAGILKVKDGVTLTMNFTLQK